MPKINFKRLKTLFSDLKSKIKLPKSVSGTFLKYKKIIYFFIGTLLLIPALMFLKLTYQGELSQFMITSKKGSSLSSPSPSPISCISKILPGGKQVYRYTHGKDVVGPRLQVVTIDPFDPKLNQIINVTAEIKHDSPVTSATVSLVTDSKTEQSKMNLVSGNSTNGTWTAEIKLEDTYLCNYQLNFDLQSSTGNYKGSMVFRP